VERLGRNHGKIADITKEEGIRKRRDLQSNSGKKFATKRFNKKKGGKAIGNTGL